MIMLLVTKFGTFRMQQELYRSKSIPSLFNLKGNNESKLAFKRVAQVVSSHLFQEIYIKSENIVSWRLFFKNNGVN